MSRPDAVESPPWALAEQVDERARTPGAQPDPALLAALAAAIDEDVLLAMLGELGGVCGGDDRAAADRYAEHLLALAPLLPDEGTRAVRAAVDVHLADVCARAGDRATAQLRVHRCGDDLAELLPELLGDREYVLSCLADAAGRPVEARAHAARASELFTEHERWDEAALAALAAAQTHASVDAAVVDDWATAAERFTAAGRHDEARDCAEHAGGLVARAAGDPDSATGVDLPALCAAARELASHHGLPALAAGLGLAEAIHTAGTGVGWDEVVALHERGRRELAALDLDPVARRGELARVDLSLGRSAMVHGRPANAERFLTAALPALREAAMTDETQMCESMLHAVAVTVRPASAAAGPAPEGVTDPDLRAALLLTEAQRLAAVGRFDEALARVSAATAVPGSTVDPDRTLLVDGVAALVRAMAGDLGSAPAVLARLDARLAETTMVPAARAAMTELAARLRPVASSTAARLVALMRALAERELHDLDAARAQLDDLSAEAGDDPALVPLVDSARWCLHVARAVRDSDDAALARLPRQAQDHLAAMPQDDLRLAPLRELLVASSEVLAANEGDGDLAGALERVRRAGERLPAGALRDEVDAATSAVTSLAATLTGDEGTRLEQLRALDEQTRTPGLGDTERALRHAQAGAAALRGGHETDLGRVAWAVAHLRLARGLSGPDDPQRVFHLTGLALGLRRRQELTNAPVDVREANALLEEAREAAGGPAHPLWQMVNAMLAEGRGMLGEHPEPDRSALEGMRRHVWQVLAQPDLTGAALAARRAAEDAVVTARRCLAAENPADAITALDAGRGLALFAATAPDTVGEQLVVAGRRDLAARWRAAVDAGEELPSELRRAVLGALSASETAGALLDPPTYEEIRHALAVADVDALVYLVPGDGATPGYAVCAPATGAPRFLALPDLRVDGVPELDRYRAALRARHLVARGAVAPVEVPDRDLRPPADADDDLAAVVDAVCRWAWRAAARHLLQTLLPGLTPAPSSRTPRLVLVPMGDLAWVPWHAARHPRTGTYAIERVAISQMPSARLLCRSTTSAPVAPSATGLVVGDPDTGSPRLDLPAARREALGIRQAFYRGARYLGRRPDGTTSPSGPGSADEVRAWLQASGAAAGAVLHLACHGLVDPGADPPAAYLLLADGEKLFAAELVDLLRRVPERCIGLVVLAACHTGVAMTGFDEAYSLGTAFLAAGVRSVLSTQWSVPDDATSVLMFMFHHFLRVDDLPPWAALRAAQLWMLDTRRVVPEDMPHPLRDGLDRARLADVVSWAAFVHGGR